MILLIDSISNMTCDYPFLTFTGIFINLNSILHVIVINIFSNIDFINICFVIQFTLVAGAFFRTDEVFEVVQLNEGGFSLGRCIHFGVSVRLAWRGVQPLYFGGCESVEVFVHVGP